MTVDYIESIVNGTVLKELFEAAAANRTMSADLGVLPEGTMVVSEDGGELIWNFVGHHTAFGLAAQTMGQDHALWFFFTLIFEPNTLLYKLDMSGKMVSVVINELVDSDEPTGLKHMSLSRLTSGQYTWARPVFLTDIPDTYDGSQIEASMVKVKAWLTALIKDLEAFDKAYDETRIAKAIAIHMRDRDCWEGRVMWHLQCELERAKIERL